MHLEEISWKERKKKERKEGGVIRSIIVDVSFEFPRKRVRKGGKYSREARQGASFFGFISGEKLYNWWRKYIVEKVILTVNMPGVGIKGYERIGFERIVRRK